MRRRSPLLALAALSLLLSSCSSRSLLILTDQYWKAAVLQSPSFERGMRAVRKKGFRVKSATVAYSTSATKKLAADVRKSGSSMILLSPLFSGDAPVLAREFADRRFYAFGSASGQSPATEPANLVRLVPDIAPAFTRAARRIERYLAGKTPGGRIEIAALFSQSARGRRALSAFRSAIRSSSSPPLLSVLQLGSGADRGRLSQFLQDAQAKGVALYLLADPGLNAEAVTILKDDKTPIVTENWFYGSTYSNKVLFSIDEDIPSAIMKILETMGTPADKEIRVPWDIVAAASQP